MTPEQTLWCEVLTIATTEAVEGVSSLGYGSATSRAVAMDRARRYITVPNADFNQVCHMAGLDPIAVREHVSRKIANAPSVTAARTKPGRSGRVGKSITHNGEAHTAAGWADIIGISTSTINLRLRKGWTIEAMLATPRLIAAPKPKREPKPAPKASHRPAQLHTHNGQTLKLADWAKIVGISLSTLCMRKRMGWTVEAMLTTPLTKRADIATQLARRGLTHDTPGVLLNLRPLQETGGGTSAQEINDLNFSQDCAA
jgi:hypothetical protein